MLNLIINVILLFNRIKDNIILLILN